ncbi:PREDICTED: interleukin-10 receptor subunit alpha [Nanorana parkeri]|uniref:interleukin-10 receptor subunit alpha n=1 Tax=Nanorana parkeri TaxID=125878 RepID=UPI000854E7A3|nr:PREDICTED: interleukin-10 receptor subunit alpha [Nanorana parkeri]
MAKLGLSMLGCVPLQIAIVVHLLVSTKGDLLMPPENVNFQLGFFHHILNWSRNKSDSDGILYQVEYRSYGSNWTSVPNCTFISHLSCDLTVETLPKSLGFYARVRSILGDQASEWARTTRYTFNGVVLPPPSVQVDVDGSSLFVQLTLPKIIAHNITQRFEEIFPVSRMYTIDIRRTSDNHMFKHVEYCETFHIVNLVGGQEYCIKIQPSIASRGNTGEATSESCIYLPEQGVSSSTLLVVASCILAFVVLLIFVNIFICLYVRGVVKTPKTLMSLIQRSWSWMDKPSSPVIEKTLHWENGLIEHLMAEHRDSLVCSSADSGFGSQMFVINMSKSSRDSSVDESVSTSKSNITNINTQEEVSCERESSKDEDSGISLSTGSHNLSSCSDSSDDIDSQSCGNCSETVAVNERLGYLKQQESEENTNNLEMKELERTWQPPMKEYLSQGQQNLLKNDIEFPHQKEFDSEPWTKLPGTIQSSLPLTVAFSPFSSKLWGLGVNVPSLGDVELMDTRS